MMKPTFENFLVLCVFGFVIFVCLYNLDYLSIRAYDEGRNAVNAFEMYLHPENFLFTTFENKIDTWNTKPPLLIWLQVLFMNLIGPGEWAVRLPTALGGIGIMLLVWDFFKRINLTIWAVIFSLLLLFSNWLFTGQHVLRTGDYDTIFTFFSIGFIFYFYYFSKSLERKDIYIANIFLTFAILTKGIASFFFAPGILLYLLLSNQFIRIIRQKHLWISLTLPLLLGVGYYFLRESITPGYLKLIWINEIAGRYNSVENSGNINSKLYYLALLRSCFGFKTVIFVIIAFLTALYFKKEFKLVLFLITLSLTFILIISFSETKLYWYLTPVLPLISMLAGIGLVLFFELLMTFIKYPKLSYAFYTIVIFFSVKSNLITVVKDRLNPSERSVQQFSLAYKLRESLQMQRPLSEDFTYLDFEHYKPHYLFYSYLVGKKYVFQNVNSLKLESGSKIASDIQLIKDNIKESFPIAKIDSFQDLEFYTIGQVTIDSDRRFQEFKHIWDKVSVTSDIVIEESKKNPSRYVIMQPKNTDLHKINFYFRRTNADGTFDYDIVELSDNWDYTDYKGYKIKFLQLRNPAEELEFKGYDFSGNELWVKYKKFRDTRN